MGGFDETKAERGVGKAQRGAKNDCLPYLEAESLQALMALVGNGENAHGSAPPGLREGSGYQRGNGAAFIKAEAAPEFDRAVPSPQEQAQFGWTAALCG